MQSSIKSAVPLLECISNKNVGIKFNAEDALLEQSSSCTLNIEISKSQIMQMFVGEIN